jgi:monofunctional biosynthetic peptidoglycan transglycosylase
MAHGGVLRLARGLLVVATLTLLPVIVLRWLPPPVTAFMVERWVSDLAGRRPPVSIAYDWTPWSRIAPAARLAVVAAEDQRFPTHHGFDVEAIRRALGEDRSRMRGASTITQQTARNLFLWPGRSWVRKALEAYLATALELVWPKRRILEVYLNVAELGDGVYGVEAASRRFYGKPAVRLTRSEAARLAAVLPDPKTLRVDRPSPYVLARARRIEAQMAQLGTAHLDGL